MKSFEIPASTQTAEGEHDLIGIRLAFVVIHLGVASCDKRQLLDNVAHRPLGRRHKKWGSESLDSFFIPELRLQIPILEPPVAVHQWEDKPRMSELLIL